MFQGWPAPARGVRSEFSCTGQTNSWQIWTKPPGVEMVFMFALGSGGGGGGGLTAAAGNARGGGGGGAGAACASLLVPAFLIPDKLYVQVAIGAVAVGAGTLGNSGARSWISLVPSSANAYHLVLASGNANAAGGSAGTAAGSNAGASAPAVATVGTCGLISLGTFFGTGGSSGTASGAISGANGTAGVNKAPSQVTCGGAGGGTVGTNNTNFAGGDITGITNVIPTIAGGVAASGNGQPGFWLRQPFIGLGGSGGGTGGGAGTLGGNGGDGALGCGGGGGGGGTTGGSGGKGGDGYVFIVAW